MEKLRNLQIFPGSPSPLGATKAPEGVNFSLYSKGAKRVTLVLQSSSEVEEVPLKRGENGVWSVCVQGLPGDFLYGFRVGGDGPFFEEKKISLDPYAKSLFAPKGWGEERMVLSRLRQEEPFDWEGVEPPNHPLAELILYEMHVRGFTKDPSSNVAAPGTFNGMIEKIPYLKELGINAVELLPIAEFNERGPPPNYWGYSPFHFFCPMARYGGQNELRQLVKELHRASIEVILDVVYNHTGDGGSLQRIDASTYYILDDEGRHTNYTGCGNTLNCNDPVVQEWILSSLRYFVEEFHIDGFRFDLASIFCRGSQGEVLDAPPIIEAIERDPILSKKKKIAEPWDCAGLYQVGAFPGGWPDWDGGFRDALRRFIKGSDGQEESFAKAFSSKRECIHFVTAHDGFTLADLVSYNEKHNEANGEENKDGNPHNESWNCGEEGRTKNEEVLGLRARQQRNFLLALLLSGSPPMLLMGDEVGHTRNGNNNAYCQDNELNYFLWDKMDQELFMFVKELISIRKRSFFQGEIAALQMGKRLVSFQKGELFIAFHPNFEPTTLSLPSPKPGKRWHRLFDSNLHVFDSPPLPLDDSYTLAPYCSLLLVQK